MAGTKTARRRGVPNSGRADASTVEAALRREIQVANDNLGLLAARLEEATGGGPFTAARESVADLERAIIADPGWRMFTTLGEQEFTSEGRRQLRAVCRLMSLANPLIKRGLNLRSFYVWGQGVEVTARANGKREAPGAGQEQDVQAVIAAHISDRANQAALYSAQARDEAEHALGTDGEIYLALFTRPASGWVQIRTIIADEISEIITNPDDACEPWFYRRIWTSTGYNPATGVQRQTSSERLYPDIGYRPRNRPPTFAGIPVQWDAPVISVHVNRPKGWLRGVPDCYASINWARAYKEFLEQWAGLMRSLARFAWRLTADGRNRNQARTALAKAAAVSAASTPGERLDVGGIGIMPPGSNLDAIPKTGAVIDAESGRPLAMMVASGLDVPVTMLLADPGQTGARATAETLDWPTELAMMSRRSLWEGVQNQISEYVIAEAVRASDGPLKGTVKRDPVTDREIVTLDGDTTTVVDVVWPDLDGTDPKAVIDAVVAAAGTGTIPPELILRLLLQALRVRDAEILLDAMVDDNGVFQWPQAAPLGGGQGQQAANLARNGADPAAAGPGSMGPDDGTPTEPGQPGTPMEVPGVSAQAAARQADADFGLFGGANPDQSDNTTSGPPADTGQPGEQPADTFDPRFFRLAESAAVARQADADFGLFGGTVPEPAGNSERPEAGPQPVDIFDPGFFRL